MIYKVELFLTPKQWQQMAVWSLPHADGDNPDCPWLLMLHHGDKTDEYQYKKTNLNVPYSSSNIVYTTNTIQVPDVNKSISSSSKQEHISPYMDSQKNLSVSEIDADINMYMILAKKLYKATEGVGIFKTQAQAISSWVWMLNDKKREEWGIHYKGEPNGQDVFVEDD